MKFMARKHEDKHRSTPGTKLKFSDGTVLQVQANGSLRNPNPRPKLTKKQRVAVRREAKLQASK